MTSIKSLAREITRAAGDSLSETGFYRKKTAFLKPVGDHTLGVVSLNSSTRAAEQVVELFPTVGVIDKNVLKYSAKWSGYDHERQVTPMVAEPLCYLLPSKTYMLWTFQSHSDIEETIGGFTDAVLRFGLPWMEEFRDTEVVLDRLQADPGGFPEEYHYTIPAALYALGRPREAHEYIRRVVEETSKTDDEHTRKWGKKYAQVMLRI